ncbi:MAG TPA: hypothetical protein VGI27_12885 [Solirubrobacteraceae bacterium]|jgi:hypothetical protein
MSTSSQRAEAETEPEEKAAQDTEGLGGDDAGSLPVLAQEARVVRAEVVSGEVLSARETTLPAVQAAAVAAGGFVAGAAVVGLVARRQRRSQALARGSRAGRRLASGRRRSGAGELVQIVGSRSLLLDVHLLGGRD